MKFLGFAFVAGLVSALGFAPLGWWPLTIGGVAVLVALVRGAPTLRAALARGWWFGFGQFVLGLNWIATAFTFQAAMPAWLGWVAVGLLSLYLAVYPALAAGLAWRAGRKDDTALVLAFAAAWIASEWLRATLFTGFAWNPLGVALLPTGLAWLAPWIGTYGLSGIAVLLAGAVVLAAQAGGRRAAAILVVLLIAGAGLGRVALGPAPAGHGPLVRIVQPNIGQEDKWSPSFALRNLARLGALSHVPPDGVPGRILIWPEAAVTDPLEDERLLRRDAQFALASTREAVRRLIGPHELLLTGGVRFESADRLLASGATNSVFALTPDMRILARYDKAHLVPYGEYLPMRPLLSAIGLSRLAPGDLDFDPGPGPRTVTLPLAGRVGLQICYEIVFSGEVVDRANRPDWIFNPSNDAWFGRWGPPQHLAQARLRALEEGLPVVRATPTGISAVIDADGRIVKSLPLGTAGTIDARLPPPRAPTLFARLGNALPLLFALVLALAAIAVRRKAR
jgi:apolipoprotein N-acyltransferase